MLRRAIHSSVSSVLPLRRMSMAAWDAASGNDLRRIVDVATRAWLLAPLELI